MKATRLLYIFLLVIAVISNCNAQNDETHSYMSDGNNTIEEHSIRDIEYVLDFYKCNQRYVNDNDIIYMVGAGPLTNILRVSDTTLYAMITTKTTMEDNESGLETAQCDINNKLVTNILAAMYQEIIQAIDSAIVKSRHVLDINSKTIDSTVVVTFQATMEKNKFQYYFEEALFETELFNNLIEKHNIKIMQDTIND